MFGGDLRRNAALAIVVRPFVVLQSAGHDDHIAGIEILGDKFSRTAPCVAAEKIGLGLSALRACIVALAGN